MFTDLQRNFSNALLDPDHVVPSGVTARTAAATERFAIYRNNVIVGLVGALRSRFPAVEKIVGVDYFAAVARVFVSGHPPRSPVLLEYGDDFAAFLERFEPAREIPYLPDVARIESARVRAYHAADDTACDASGLVSVAPDRLPATRLILRDAVAVVRSVHPVVTIWAMNSGERPVEEIVNWAGECALIVRPGRDVVVRQIDGGAASFIAALRRGESLGVAVESALADDTDFNTTQAVADLFAHHLVASIETDTAGSIQ